MSDSTKLKKKSITNNKEDNIEQEDIQFEQGKHPNSLKNLTPFQKGVSGNLGGRPYKYKELAESLNKIGNEITLNWRGESKGYTNREGVIKKIWSKALEGDIKFVQLLAYLGCLDD
jgi:hypothetical protein